MDSTGKTMSKASRRLRKGSETAQRVREETVRSVERRAEK